MYSKEFIQTSYGKLSVVIHYPGKSLSVYNLAIIGPGFLSSKDYAHIKDLAQRFADNGYIAIRFDPIGTWESEGNITDYSASSYLNNFNIIATYSYKEFNLNKITAVGHSFGGFIAMLFAKDNNNVDKIVSILPLTKNTINKVVRFKWKLTGSLTYSKADPFDKNRIVKFKVPYSFVDDLQKYNLENFKLNTDAFKLFIASDIDKYCKANDIYELYYKKASKPKKFVLLRGVPHSYRHSEKQIHFVHEKVFENINLKM